MEFISRVWGSDFESIENGLTPLEDRSNGGRDDSKA